MTTIHIHVSMRAPPRRGERSGYVLPRRHQRETRLDPPLRRRPLRRPLVADIVMAGGIDGVDLAESSRRQFASVAVLLVSGYADAMIDDGTPVRSR
jgi:hypothetical protein